MTLTVHCFYEKKKDEYKNIKSSVKNIEEFNIILPKDNTEITVLKYEDDKESFSIFVDAESEQNAIKQ